MALASAVLRLASRSVGAGFPARLGPLAAALQVEAKLTAQSALPPVRGLASVPPPPPPPPSSGREEQQRAESQAAEAAVKQQDAASAARGEHPAAAAPQQQETAQDAPGADGGAAAGAASGGVGGAQQEQQEQPQQKEGHQGPAVDPPRLSIEDNPMLRQYIESLKALKGSSTVQRQTVGGDRAWWQSLLVGWLGPILEGWVSDFVKGKIETDFDKEDFLEGAKEAFATVHELMLEEDWEALRPMVSAKLHAAFQDTAAEYRKNGLVYRIELSGTPQAALRGMGFMPPDIMREYDPGLAALAPDGVPLTARPVGTWLVLSVEFSKMEQLTTITREEDGQVVAELRDLRPARWKFATGPLPGPLPTQRLETSWLLLSIV